MHMLVSPSILTLDIYERSNCWQIPTAITKAQSQRNKLNRENCVSSAVLYGVCLPFQWRCVNTRAMFTRHAYSILITLSPTKLRNVVPD